MLNRTSIPTLAPLSVPSLLPYSRQQLSNGIEVIYIHDPAQEVFKIDVVFEAGVFYQPRPLIASTALNMLNEGTRHHTAEEISEIFDYYGAYIDFNCGLNKMEINLISLNKYGDKTIPMLSEMIAESIVPEKELEIFLRNKRQEFLVTIEKTSYLARKEFSRLLFGENHPYANNVAEQDYNQVNSDMVREYYRQYINARNCRIVACGNINSEILSQIEQNFSSLTCPQDIPSQPVHSFNPAQPGKYSVFKEDAVQSSLRIGKMGLRLTDPDYAEFQLLNTILGGYFGSRLMSNIREEKGYTYGIQSFNVSMPESSYWCIATEVNSDHSDATIEETFKEIRKLQTELIPEDELDLVKNFLHGDLMRELDGVFAQSDSLKHKLNYELDNQIYLSIIETIKNSKAHNLRDLANKYWAIDDMYIVTAGSK